MVDVSRINPILREMSLIVNNHDENVTNDIKPQITAAAENTRIDEEIIRVKVHRQGMDPILFKMKKSTPMKKLMHIFSKEANIGLDGLRFLIDGKRIQEDDTPRSLELEPDDLIEVFQYQLGGSTSYSFELNHLLS